MEYKFSHIEKKWQQTWKETNVYKVSNDSSRPKYYVLDMFPYPSGAGLHVGHPLGYIASDIFARFKRLKGFNVLHPMGYDAFGLPAEQYAIDHGIHPAVSTDDNIKNFRQQLDNIGFCYDWDREIKTSDPHYYKWTQWIFLQLFHSWFNRKTKKAEPIDKLIKLFEKEGNASHPCPGDSSIRFTAPLWISFEEHQQMDILMQYRLAYCGIGEVNWCEALGTVLANDEVINGVSERGGFPVVKKKLRQWYLRITEYADRLLEGLETVEFSDAMKEMQSNWIGKSYGAEISFAFKSTGPQLAAQSSQLTVYTTRPDTIFGVDFMVIAPEHELIDQITTPGQKQAVEDYLTYVKSRSERERMAEKKISGVFTGAYVLNPFDGREIPVWISEYVLAGYGTGAIMAVPCGDERDHKFARHFNIPITNIIGSYYNGEEANPTKDAILENSGFLNGLVMRAAMEVAITKLEELGIGIRKVNYKMRDAAFSRQRYWGEPFPIAWKEGVAYALPESELPVTLPQIDEIKPGKEGEGPLSNLPEWINSSPIGGQRESSTMPGYAGSSWYFLRYMDPHNDNAFCDRKASDYWGQVDLYIGGTEHAVGHLLYSRMWTKALYDLGHIGFDEPFKKLVNQGMIQGSSRFVYRFVWQTMHKVDVDPSQLPSFFISKGIVDSIEKGDEDAILKVKDTVQARLKELGLSVSFVGIGVEVAPLHVDVNIVDGVELDTAAFKKWRHEYANAEFILEEGKYICGSEVEKMSKSKFNTVNPDILVERYGSDTFRMYEMFLGPVGDSKPWDTKGIEGVHRFLKKLWRLFYDDVKGQVWNTNAPTDAEWKVLHKAIKRAEEDTERFSFNTTVSTFMICVNDLSELKCTKKDILQPLLILLTPYAPHVCEELWHLLGNTTTILDATYPTFEPKYLVESNKEYPISVNGKLRTTINIALDAPQEEVEKLVLSNDVIQKWMEGKPHKKVIYVKGKMVNVVI
ncbi:leucine--tRNA ligase [Paraflavitalea soli]|uniref:Leucine--tRNA ligase n=1 Tax=Paraflavitalea soli TaxID=2315862 RepID=A0A3B7MWJ0_9BACT|nr:class I tRNA ligase family protein [Paraflavitalea soli]AXY77400.1 leucine--tRNA ligase [Paraflavitalea soli]